MKKRGTLSTGLALLVSLAFLSLAGLAQGAHHAFTPVASPVLNADEAVAKPIAVGPAAAGGATLNLQIATASYSEEMDFYIGIYAPTVNPEFFFLKPNNDLQPISEGIVPWRRGM